jgi:UDP-N-acetylmuramoyl-tripeptide--D-alanyl-D-alanine ligase
VLTWRQIQTWLGDQAPGFVAPSAPAPAPTALITDSRRIGRGQWFVPLSGENFDGHQFIAAALAEGAAGYFYAAARAAELPPELRARGVAVTEPLAAMQCLAAGWRRTLTDLKLIALTGSTGKTTTKEMLGAILRAAGPTYATEASFNNEIGVPKTLLQLRPQHRFAAVEFGARMPGNIRFLCNLADPDVVGLINVGMTHVGIFGSVENLLATKLEIFAASGSRAYQVAFHDDPRILAGARATGKPTLTFGADPAADVALVGTEWSKDGTMQVSLRVRGEPLAVRLGVAHTAYPINAAAAAAMASAAGIGATPIAAGLAAFTGIKGR